MDARPLPHTGRQILLVQDVRSGAVFAVGSRGYVAQRAYCSAGWQEPPVIPGSCVLPQTACSPRPMRTPATVPAVTTARNSSPLRTGPLRL